MKYTMSRGRDEIILNTETGKITGNTYGMKDVIKSDLYATWNAAEKCWESDKLAETIEEYKSYLTRCYKLAAIEDTAAEDNKPAYRKAFASQVNGLCPRCHTYCCGDCSAN